MPKIKKKNQNIIFWFVSGKSTEREKTTFHEIFCFFLASRENYWSGFFFNV